MNIAGRFVSVEIVTVMMKQKKKRADSHQQPLLALNGNAKNQINLQ
jgi:hypothetical protein